MGIHVSVASNAAMFALEIGSTEGLGRPKKDPHPPPAAHCFLLPVSAAILLTFRRTFTHLFVSLCAG